MTPRGRSAIRHIPLHALHGRRLVLPIDEICAFMRYKVTRGWDFAGDQGPLFCNLNANTHDHIPH